MADWSGAFTSASGASEALRTFALDLYQGGKISEDSYSRMFDDALSIEEEVSGFFTFTEEDNIAEAAEFWRRAGEQLPTWGLGADVASDVRAVLQSAGVTVADEAEREDLQDTTTIVVETASETAKDTNELAATLTDWKFVTAVGLLLAVATYGYREITK